MATDAVNTTHKAHRRIAVDAAHGTVMDDDQFLKHERFFQICALAATEMRIQEAVTAATLRAQPSADDVLRDIAGSVADAWPMNRETYPCLSDTDFCGYARHIAAHVSKDAGKLHAAIEVSDHGRRLDTRGIRRAVRNLFVDAFRLSVLFGWSPGSLVDDYIVECMSDRDRKATDTVSSAYVNARDRVQCVRCGNDAGPLSFMAVDGHSRRLFCSQACHDLGREFRERPDRDWPLERDVIITQTGPDAYECGRCGATGPDVTAIVEHHDVCPKRARQRRSTCSTDC